MHIIITTPVGHMCPFRTILFDVFRYMQHLPKLWGKKSTKLSFFFQVGLVSNMNDLSCKGEKIAPRIDQTRPPPSHSIKGVTGLYFPTRER